MTNVRSTPDEAEGPDLLIGSEWVGGDTDTGPSTLPLVGEVHSLAGQPCVLQCVVGLAGLFVWVRAETMVPPSGVGWNQIVVDMCYSEIC